MEENIRKVRKSRISTGKHSAVKRGRVHRFAKWCADRYDISWRGIYESFRGSNTSRWKWEGMMNCVKEFAPEHEGSLQEFWNGCVRNHFAEFMAAKGICRMTLWKRFGADDWNELETEGIKAMYVHWLREVELKN